MRRIVEGVVVVAAAVTIVALPGLVGALTQDVHAGHEPNRHDEFDRIVPRFRRVAYGMGQIGARMEQAVIEQMDRDAWAMAYNAESVR